MTVRSLKIPCEVFTLRIVSAPHRGLSPLERLVLEAIVAGADTLEQLDSLFLLGHRPLLDVVSDLWRAGHLRIDMGRGKLLVTEEARQKLQNASADQADQASSARPPIEGGQRSSRRIELVHDLLSNELLPWARPDALDTWGGPRSLPPVHDLGSYVRLPLVSLEKAARQRLRDLEEKEAGQGEKANRQRHQLIHFDFGEMDDGSVRCQLRYLRIQVETRTGSAGEGRFEIVAPDFLPTAFRHRLSRDIPALAREMPPEHVPKVLEEILSDHARRSPSLSMLGETRSQFARLIGAAVERATAIAIDEAVVLDDDLRAEAHELVAEIEQRESSRGRVRWIAGDEALREAVSTTLGDAKRQVVLSSPVVHWSCFKTYYELLEKRLRDGIRIILLWGSTARTDLEDEVRRALITLNRLGDLQWSRRPTQTGASFLLRDADAGVLSGAPIFASASHDSLSAFVRLPQRAGLERSPLESDPLERQWRGDPVLQPIVDELARVQRTALEIQIEQAVVVPSEQPPDIREAHRLPPLRPSMFSHDEVAAPEALRAWADEWSRWHRRTEARAEGARDSLSMVHDHQHWRLLDEVLDERPARLVIGSGILRAAGLDPGRVEQLESLLRAGGRLLIVHGEGQRPDSRTDETLAELRGRYPDRFRIHPLRVRGGLIATETLLLITSLALLDRQPTETEDLARRRLDTGLLVRGPEQVREGLITLFAKQEECLRFLDLERSPEPARSVAPSETEADPDLLIRHAWATLLPRLMGELDRDGDGKPAEALWEEWLRDISNLAAPLAAFGLVAPQLGQGFRKRARLVALRLTTRLDDESAAVHLGELARELWREGRLFEAVELFDALEGLSGDRLRTPAGVPPPWLRHLVWATGRGVLGEGMLEALEVPVEDTEVATAVVSATTRALVESASEEAYELLKRFLPAAPPALVPIGTAALDYYSETMRRLPWHALEQDRIARDLRAEQEEFLAAAREAFEGAKALSFNFDLGKITWRYLFRDDGAFGPLEPILKAGQVDQAVAWLADWDGQKATTAGAMDAASRRVFEEVPYIHDALITHRRRDNYLKRLEALVESVRAWIGARPTGVDADRSLLDSAKRLVSTWEVGRDDLAELARQLGESGSYAEPLAASLLALVDACLFSERPRPPALAELWSDSAWRFPDLWIAGPERLPPGMVAAAVLDGLVERIPDPEGALDRLLRDGRIEAALRLAPRCGIESDVPEILNRAARHLRERRTLLMRRLRRARAATEPEVTEVLNELESIARTSDDLVRAGRLLDRLEQLTWDAEREPTRDLEAPDDADAQVAVFPRLDPWVNSELSTVDALRRLRDWAAEPDAVEPRDRTAVTRLVDILSRVLLHNQPIDRGWATELGLALDTLLGGEIPANPPVVRREGSFIITTLRALPSPWLPAIDHEYGGWPLWIPVHELSESELESPDPRLRLYFDPLFDPRNMADERPDWSLRISPELVFRTLTGPFEKRRPTWLCEIGRQISLDSLLCRAPSTHGVRDDLDALGTLLTSLEPPVRAADRREARRLVQGFLEISGIRGLEPVDIDYVVDLAGYHRYWIRIYLHHLCLWLHDKGIDRRHFTPDALDEVWFWGEFRRSVASDLEKFVQGHIDLAYVLATTIYHWVTAPGADGVPLQVVESDLVMLNEVSRREAYRQLDLRGLARVGEKTVRPPTGAAGTLLIDNLIDRLDEIEERAERNLAKPETAPG